MGGTVQEHKASRLAHNAEVRVAYTGTVLVNLSGHRKPTAYRCNACSAAQGHTVWHDTARGLSPEECPLNLVGHVVGHSAVSSRTGAPALIPREKLGTPPAVTHWQVAKIGGTVPLGED